MSHSLAMQPHQDYTKGTQANAAPLKYNVPEGQKTKGEKIYDFHNYGTVGYGAVLALSLVITDFMEHGKGRFIWEATEKPLAKQFEKVLGASAKSAAKYSEVIHTYFYLTSGGTVLMAPMLWAENRKSKLTYLANRKYAPEVLPENDPNQNLTAKEILNDKFDENRLPQPLNEQPKHGIGNAAWRRGLGVATIALGWSTLSTKIFGKKKIYDTGVKAGEKLVEAIGHEGLTKFAEKPVFKRYAGYTLDDGINTVITAGLLAATNGAGKGNTHGEQVANADQPIAESPSAHIASPAIQANHLTSRSLDDDHAPSELAAQANHVDGVEKRSHHSEDLSLGA